MIRDGEIFEKKDCKKFFIKIIIVSNFYQNVILQKCNCVLILFFTCQGEIQFNKTEDPFSLQDGKTIDKIDNYVAPVIVLKGKLSLYVP